jgi:flagellar assembly protein FliH
MDASFHVRPFAFDRIFTATPNAPSNLSIDDLRLQVAALTAEAERLRQDQEATLALARAEAFEAGLAQARGERESALLAAVDALHAGIETIEQTMDVVIRQVTADGTEVALAAAELLAARAIEQAPAAAIDAAIGRALAQVARGQELLVWIHPDLADEVERLIATRQSRDRRRLNLHVARDETLLPGDVRIEWDKGGLTLDHTARAAAIRNELDALLPGL